MEIGLRVVKMSLNCDGVEQDFLFYTRRDGYYNVNKKFNFCFIPPARMMIQGK